MVLCFKLTGWGERKTVWMGGDRLMDNWPANDVTVLKCAWQEKRPHPLQSFVVGGGGVVDSLCCYIPFFTSDLRFNYPSPNTCPVTCYNRSKIHESISMTNLFPHIFGPSHTTTAWAGLQEFLNFSFRFYIFFYYFSLYNFWINTYIRNSTFNKKCANYSNLQNNNKH